MLTFWNRVTGACTTPQAIDLELSLERNGGLPKGYDYLPFLCSLYEQGLTVEQVDERCYAALRTSVSVKDYWMARAASFIARWYEVRLDAKSFVASLPAEVVAQLKEMLHV